VGDGAVWVWVRKSGGVVKGSFSSSSSGGVLGVPGVWGVSESLEGGEVEGLEKRGAFVLYSGSCAGISPSWLSPGR